MPKVIHSAMVSVPSADMTTEPEVAAVMLAAVIPPAITTAPITPGLDVPITNIAPTAVNISVPAQVTVLPIQAGLAVIGMNTAGIVTS